MAVSDSGFSGGILVPVQPSHTGGFRLLEGDEYITQLIVMLTSDDDSDNPFLELGLGLGVVFANLSDGAWKAQLKKHITDTFAELERAQLARLLTVTFENGPGEAEVTINIRYYSIETATEQDVRLATRRS